MKIVADFIDGTQWRKGVWTCPECEYGERENRDGLELHEIQAIWEMPKQIVELVIRKDAPNQKGNGIMVSSECPKCFSISYHHWSFGFFETCNGLYKYPKDIVKRVKAEKTQRQRIADAWWKSSPCNGCKCMKKILLDCGRPYITCDKPNSTFYGSALREGEKCEEKINAKK